MDMIPVEPAKFSKDPQPFAELGRHIQTAVDQAQAAGTAATQAVYMAHRVILNTIRAIKNGRSTWFINNAKESAQKAAQDANQAKTLADEALAKVTKLTTVTTAKNRMHLTSKLKYLAKHLLRAKECVDKTNKQAQMAYKNIVPQAKITYQNIFTRRPKRTNHAEPDWKTLETSAQSIRRVDDQIEKTCNAILPYAKAIPQETPCTAGQ